MSKKNRVIKNVLSLSFVQVSNYILPIFTVPYVTRIIGVEKFGLINLSYATISYFALFVNYSFDLTSSKLISINIDNSEKIKIIVSTTYACKLILLVINTLVFICFLDNFVDSKSQILYKMTYILVFGNFLFPYWYFMGIEKLSLASIFTFLTKLVTTIIIFFVINKEEDYYWQNLAYSLSSIIFGMIGFLYVSNKINYNLITFKNTFLYLKEGGSTFATFVINTFYSLSGIVILGVFSTIENVGIFAASSKLINIIYSIFILPLGQAVFPVVSRNIIKNKCETIDLIAKYLPIIIIIFTIISLTSFVFAESLIMLLYGGKFDKAILPMKILSFLPIFMSINLFLNVQIMVNLELYSIRLKIYSIGLFFNVIVNFFLIKKLEYISSALAWMLTEILIFVLSINYLNKVNINIFRFEYFSFRSIKKQINKLRKVGR